MSRTHHHSSSGSKKSRPTHSLMQQHIESLETHRVNTLTELCRIERVAAACENEEDSRAFQAFKSTRLQMAHMLRGLRLSRYICSSISHCASVS
ncbi:hypothetical protein PG994_015303 [Apiospora phragmitis]|uniref:Uncharacterized protein n=1 Tax=Apiospora phragmitis TaxID=2905665 RepID=A0ABR1SR61_9PEZI